MAHYNSIRCNNSNQISVLFIPNGGDLSDIFVFAEIDGEYWYKVGKSYKNAKNAKRAAVKSLAEHGYTFDEKEMAALEIC